ncbi:AraC-like DNA-binding protein/mannose-6-phosphate isomerase-like protein (cupin superfamily) [Paenibacillus castaneae]|uniref:AraC family transcriptional regulator n=1 Tax=Paenibacillus castaneae TaxID=474957 RepID=UPI000C9A3A95|nr:AraC family transcriptional regulator [Paenibacillus castaneae]NIK79722.1 AraC-like DNA-binding protein/mannose-6-phosphate isomerase-like protein (cupin superfamily) [Paenibacillus castaneae]
MVKIKTDTARWVYEFPESNQLSQVPELIMLGYDRFHEASPLNVHQHERSYEFVFVESGKVTWEVDGHLFPSHAGQFFYTQPGEWHRARLNFIEPCSIWWMIITDPSDHSGWLNLLDEDRMEIHHQLQQLPRIVFVDSRVREPFSKLRDIIEHHESFASCRVRHYVLDIILQILSPSSNRQIPFDLHAAMIKLTEAIKAAPEKRWNNKELADMVSVSESHFYRLFRDMHGQSPANYIDRLRMDHACQMLRQQEVSVTTVAMDLGYKTSQHFSTVFKKFIGLSPSQWRRAPLDPLA